MEYSLDQEQLDAIEVSLQKNLMELGVHSVFLIDMAGNVIVDLNDGHRKHDIYSLAALAAGNFGAVNAMADLIGEKEFSLLFHKGDKESLHFSKVSSDFILVTIFGTEVSLGFLRLKVAEVLKDIEKYLNTTPMN
jgi:predicted regulator of Ras-like GTPase activity (Roadblock/LC7/MglB family)